MNWLRTELRRREAGLRGLAFPSRSWGTRIFGKFQAATSVAYCLWRQRLAWLLFAFILSYDQTRSQEIGLPASPVGDRTPDTGNKAGNALSLEVLRQNRQLANHPECMQTKPILIDEIVDAIKKVSKPDYFTDEEFAAVKRIADDRLLSDNAQLRQYVRYYAGRSMQHGRWVRLVVVSASGFPLNIEVRNEVSFERPLTQRERWEYNQIKRSGSFTLMSRFVSWFSENAAFHEKMNPSIDYTPLADEVRTAIEAKNVERFLTLVHQTGVTREDILKVRVELESIIERGIDKLEIEPRMYAGHLRQAQGFKVFEPNLTVEAYLKITLKSDLTAGAKTLSDIVWLELGNAAGQPKLASYVVSEDRTRDFIGKLLSGPLSASGGYHFQRSDHWSEFGGMKIEAPEEFSHLRQANLELWKFPPDFGEKSRHAE